MTLALAAFHIAIIVIAAAILVAAAVSDGNSYRIPNYLCGLLLILFPLFVITSPHDIDWRQNSMIFVLVGISGFAMFLGHMAGAGDIKLLAVSSLWAGPHLIAVLIAVTALAGIVLSLIMALLIHMRQKEKDYPPNTVKVPIPYGIAVAAGGLAVLGMIAQPILMPI